MDMGISIRKRALIKEILGRGREKLRIRRKKQKRASTHVAHECRDDLWVERTVERGIHGKA